MSGVFSEKYIEPAVAPPVKHFLKTFKLPSKEALDRFGVTVTRLMLSVTLHPEPEAVTVYVPNWLFPMLDKLNVGPLPTLLPDGFCHW